MTVGAQPLDPSGYGEAVFDRLAEELQDRQGYRSNVEKWLGMDATGERPRDVVAKRVAGVVEALDRLHDASRVVIEMQDTSIVILVDDARDMLVRFGLRDAELIEIRGGSEWTTVRSPYRFAPASLLYRFGSRRWGARFSAVDEQYPRLPLRRAPNALAYWVIPDDAQSWGLGPRAADPAVAYELAAACLRSPDELLERIRALEADDRRLGLGSRDLLDRTEGCLLGGAVGDALGYPIEFATGDEIVEFAVSPGGFPIGDGSISDDTQLTLFTAEQLAALEVDDERAVRQASHTANRHWYRTQTSSRPDDGGTGLAAEPWLYARRAPGATMMGSIGAVAQQQDADQVVDASNGSKGCGTVMRAAPYGLITRWSPRRAFDAAASAAALTHGHRTASTAAGAMAMIVRLLVVGSLPVDAVRRTIDFLAVAVADGDGDGETIEALRAAYELVLAGGPSRARVQSLGSGWTAEEALAIAVYAFLAFPEPARVVDALVLAVSHDGDSDSTGAICGNLLGAAHGRGALPADLADHVEGRATILRVAEKLAATGMSGGRDASPHADDEGMH
ncbi:ADP-ribosylglycohydrolase family protein [Agromyces salentinus]|uniref:ADP-ribosylglycohydrolase family protein n=1 Tax=Agromyces salentinus TaxID=269421 RepID=A0ABP4Z8S6_9MICO|nr:ADP-ribosylglycohydrolase family protein [Agromyces salentinus]